MSLVFNKSPLGDLGVVLKKRLLIQPHADFKYYPVTSESFIRNIIEAFEF
jgi:hypothetical protein